MTSKPDLNLRPRFGHVAGEAFFTAICWCGHAAVEQYPGARLTLRQGARVILKRPE